MEEKNSEEMLIKGSPEQSSVLFQGKNSQPRDNEIQIQGAFGLLLSFMGSVCNGCVIAGNNL